MVIVDSSVWIDYLRGTPNAHVEWLHREADRQQIGLTDFIYCEVLQGIPSEAAFERVRRLLQRFPILTTGGLRLAEVSARNYRYLRGKGVTIRSTIDCMVASFCLEDGHSLVHRDRDYDPFEKILGLRVVAPEAATRRDPLRLD